MEFNSHSIQKGQQNMDQRGKEVRAAVYIATHSMLMKRREALVNILEERPEDQLIMGQVVEINQIILKFEYFINDLANR